MEALVELVPLPFKWLSALGSKFSSQQVHHDLSHYGTEIIQLTMSNLVNQEVRKNLLHAKNSGLMFASITRLKTLPHASWKKQEGKKITVVIIYLMGPGGNHSISSHVLHALHYWFYGRNSDTSKSWLFSSKTPDSAGYSNKNAVSQPEERNLETLYCNSQMNSLEVSVFICLVVISYF
ncbi:uncharacterized protein LOC107857912 isoform X2 [Capsicum annuum]|uniref:uncharacterized protein LOC107857912 isoform X2 n=1 Tax=Capsicum annuum TaxID=4072 RepID=UPI001FB17C41|nr:uncharacterized protein LOC107857912 isoform X2 [Capsicum annuum]XP_047262497.1 uncharacterized protein LOC107857912 isoform X2 [Capsicum annuum]XP_047262498.1 uncharacterized protein LOC107857912 isoform X2 [Capsicum annuum]